jgi:hypothetical protein
MLMFALNHGGFNWLINSQIDQTVKAARDIFEGVPSAHDLNMAENRAYKFAREIDQNTGAANPIPITDEYDGLTKNDKKLLLMFSYEKD